MKFFIASPWRNNNAVKDLTEALRLRGHAVYSFLDNGANLCTGTSVVDEFKAFVATGGIFLGGGIAPKIVGKLGDATFMKAFIDKGRLSSLLELIPVRVIMNDMTALLGAASVAAMQAGVQLGA